MLEKEIKVLLSQSEFCRLLESFEWEEPFQQINYYYGSKDYIDDSVTVRIRECMGYKLQVKIPHNSFESLHVKQEFEESVDGVCCVITKQHLETLTNCKFTVDKILHGKLVTTRRIFRKYPGLELAMDINQYLDKTDYELEIEFQEEYPIELIRKLEKMNLRFNKSIKGKKSRFFERLNSMAIEDRSGICI